MLNNVTDYLVYFTALAEAHRDIRDFAYGNSERILNRQRSKIKYPLLWLEVPDFSENKFSEEGGVLYGSMVILMNYKKGDSKQYLEREELTLKIMQQIVARMIEESAEGSIRLLSNNIKIEACDPWSADNDLGWRIDFQLRVDSECYDDNVKDGVWEDQITNTVVTDDFTTVVEDDFGVTVSEDLIQ